MEILGKLTAQIAHELNNPIDGMTGFVKMAQTQLNNGNLEKVSQYLNNIEIGLNQMAVTLSDLLSYSRPDTQESEKICTNELLEHSIILFEQAAAKKNVNIIRHFSNESANIVPGLLPGVFNNIIKNAIQATDHGSIYIKTVSYADSVSISIRDTGSGIPDKYLNDIFKPFFTTKKKTEGTGLGLAICKEIIERRGGSISARNHPEGGCEFEIDIPVDYCL